MAGISPLVRRVDRLRAAHGSRVCIGIAGPPGTGKSTVAEQLHEALGPEVSVIVPMDGFHLAQSVIAGTPLARRRGAIDTFDAAGYVALIRRIMSGGSETVYAPEFRRSIEDPIAGAIPVPPDVPVVITEGNYLLVDEAPWTELRTLMTEAWFVDTDEDVRTERLIARHVQFGKAPEAARAWVAGPDAANARFIATTRERADLVIDWD